MSASCASSSARTVSRRSDPVDAKHPSEGPAGTFQNPLAPHVRGPFVGTVELVAIEFDRQPPVIGVFGHDVDAVARCRDLGERAVATAEQLGVNVTLEARFALVDQVLASLSAATGLAKCSTSVRRRSRGDSSSSVSVVPAPC